MERMNIYSGRAVLVVPQEFYVHICVTMARRTMVYKIPKEY
jgi:hypothetical protein